MLGVAKQADGLSKQRVILFDCVFGNRTLVRTSWYGEKITALCSSGGWIPSPRPCRPHPGQPIVPSRQSIVALFAALQAFVLYFFLQPLFGDLLGTPIDTLHNSVKQIVAGCGRSLFISNSDCFPAYFPERWRTCRALVV